MRRLSSQFLRSALYLSADINTRCITPQTSNSLEARMPGRLAVWTHSGIEGWLSAESVEIKNLL
jgi:hypothetical protein